MNVERDLLGARCPTFVAEAVNVFPVRMCDKGIIFCGSGLLIILAISEGIFDLKEEVRVSVQLPERRLQFPGSAKRLYPKINLQVPTTSELSVANLERDSHLVVAMQRFMEAFSRMCFELDVVSHGGRHPSQCGDQQGWCKESHIAGFLCCSRTRRILWVELTKTG